MTDTTDSIDHVQARAGWREWVGLAVLALPLLVLALDISVLYLAVPTLTESLDASATEQLWIADVYGFVIAGFLLAAGSIGDRVGRRRVLLVGAAAFSVASLLAAFSPSPEWLIAARALLGVAGATLMPSTLALITTMFEIPAQRRFAVAVWMTTFSAGAALGPIVGGVLLNAFWWGAVFLLAVPIMVLLLVLGPWLLPADRPADAGTDHARVDVPSVALSLATMLPVAYGIKSLAADGVTPTVLLAIAIGIGAGVVFVRRQHALPTPLLDMDLFTRPAFRAAVSMLFIVLVAVNGLMFLVPQYLQLVAGQPVLTAALSLLPVAVLGVVGSLATPALATRFGTTRLIVAGALLAAGAAIGLVVVGGTGASPAITVALVALALLGVSPAAVLGTDLVIGSVPPSRSGAAAAVSETAGEFGVAMGVALTGSLATAVYVATLAPPPGLSAEATGAARDGLARAVGIADEVPVELRAALLDASRDAFGRGLSVAGAASAALFLAVAALAFVAQRKDPADR